MPENSELSMSGTESHSILVLSKRQYMNQDLLDNRYGRFWEIPLSLACMGNHVAGLCLSYKHRPEVIIEDIHNNGVARLNWQSLNLFRLFPWWKSPYLKTIDAIAKKHKPDVIWACSDALHAILGMFVSNRLGVPLVIDLYDNFESFGLTQLPGMKAQFKLACCTANGLTPVSHMLDDFTTKHYGLANTPSLVLNNAINKDIFYPRPKKMLRELLDLPLNAKLIGTAGALTSNRGIETLLHAFEIMAKDNKDIWLVVAGPRDKTLSNFHHDRLIDMGTLDLERVAQLYSTLDVAIICNIDSNFGRYCFPQKFYEIVACNTPVVTANVGEMKQLLRSRPDCLFTPNSINDLVVCIHKQLTDPSPITDIPIPSWADQAAKLNGFIQTVINTK